MNIGAGKNVNSLTLNQPTIVTIPVGASVDTLTVNAVGTTVNNDGTITVVEKNADVEIEGNQPETVKPGPDVVTLVGTRAELEIALNNPDVKSIKFTKDIETSSQVLVKQADKKIDGGNFKLIAKVDMTYSEPNKSILTVLGANGVTISNLTVDASAVNMADNWDGIYTLQVYNANNVALNKVSLLKGDGGLLVNGSTVTATDITTIGNEFGGIEVSKGTAVGLSNSTLTINGTSVHEDLEGKPAIWVYPTQGELISDLYVATATEQGKNNNQTYYNLKTSLSVYDFVIGEYGVAKAGKSVDVPVTLKATTINKVGYEAVIAEVETTQKPTDSTVKFYAVDSNNSPIEQTDNGVWGPNSGFALTKNYNQTTPFKVTFSKKGEYKITVKLKDKITGDYIAEKTVTVNVNSPENTDDSELNALKIAAQEAIENLDVIADVYSDAYKTAVDDANTKVIAARQAGVTDIQIGIDLVAKLDAANDFLAPVSATLSGGGEFIVGQANTFTVTANSKIGSKGTEGTHYTVQEWAGSQFTYTTDGAFYTIELTKENTPVEFNSVFTNFSLQTIGSNNIQEYTQTSTGRTGADFGNAGHTGTKFYSVAPWNEVGTLYYGIHSNIAGVNFNNGATASIDMKGLLKDEVAAGVYNITVTMYESAQAKKGVKHADKTSLKVLDSVNYTITVPTPSF